ncbi:MAG: hypothetical protein IKL06_02700 [Lachnospiraceae bacterium]|nr:hypothetical protein [Lachnospiraceae bacterium]
MKIHITNLYNLNPHDELVEKQHRFANAGRELGFTEMGIFSYPVETDTPSELSKRLDGIISALESDDVVFIQLPTNNGYEYENLLFHKIKAYRNTKIIFLLHNLEPFSDTFGKATQDNFIALFQQADAIIAPSVTSSEMLKSRGLTNLLFYDNITLAEKISSSISGATQTSSSNKFNSYISLCKTNFYFRKTLMDALELAFQNTSTYLQSELYIPEDEIQIAFGLHDKTGNYSMWIGVTMQSIIEHTHSKICFHILHDDTLIATNANKLSQIAKNAGHTILFHYLDSSLFSEIANQVERYTIGTMFRTMCPELLPQVSRIIYLDADLLVNKDIKELWEIDITNYYLAAVPDMGINNGAPTPFPVKQKQVKDIHYFNAGVLYLNLNEIRRKGSMCESVLQYLQDAKESLLPDQDALNALYTDKVLLLNNSWNYFAHMVHCSKEKLESKIYHYAGTKLKLSSLTEMDLLYFETICRTPWGKEEGKKYISSSLGRQIDRAHQLERVLFTLSNRKIKRIFYGEESFAMKNLYKLISIQASDYRILKKNTENFSDILPCKNFANLLNEKKGTYIVFVLPEADDWTAIDEINRLGLQHEVDYFIIPRLLVPEQGGYI